ncbi:MAG TPA: GTPase ObgE, partial [Tenericutes bacterium]|nr:GTPase ObgE [Mycoplasmatota bacterium]
MFIDEVKLKVEAGRGGDGIIAFRREKYVPLGGPSGGDGGRGGDIIFKVDEGLSTLMDLRYQKIIKGNDGERGGPKNFKGKDGEDVVIKVPPGTIVKDINTNKIIADLKVHGEEKVIARGGRGGRGNKSFATRNNPAPNISEKGEPGEVRE